MEKQNIPRAAVFMSVAAIMAAILSAVVKGFSLSFSTYTLVFFRFFAPLTFVLLPLVLRGKLMELKTKVFWLHFLRALSLCLGTYAFFYALRYMPVMDANLFYNAAPIFIPVFAWLFLGEKTSKRTWIGLAVSFIGVILILKPGHDLFNPVALLALFAGVMLAIYMTLLRKLAETETTTQCIFYFLAISSALSALPLAVFGWEAVPLAHFSQLQGLASVELFIVLGLTVWGIQYLLTRAYALAPAVIVGSLIYVSIPASALLDWVFWHHAPDLVTVGGALLLTAGALIITKRERRK